MKDSNLVEYTISAVIPDEIRTRAAATAAVGPSGLYEFENRTINKLWYAIYYDGALITNGEIVREDETPFKVTYSASKDTDPSKLYFFFWAGNRNDKVTNTTSGTVTLELVRLNYSQKTVEIDHQNINGSNKNFQVYDSFTGYFQFSEKSDDSTRAKSFTLKRPFAEIHVLTDDFQTTDLKDKYSSGFICYSGLSISPISMGNTDSSKATVYFPYSWNYEKSTLTFQSKYLGGSTGSSFNTGFGYFTNDLSNSVPTITYKNRELDYLTCFYIFAPITVENTYPTLNFAVAQNTNSFGGNKNRYNVNIPEEGIKPNTKYVIITSLYDKYTIEVDEDNTWGETFAM